MEEIKLVNYEDSLIKELKDPLFAIQYLNSCLDEKVDNIEERKKIFLGALSQIMKAHGISKIARECNLNRGNIYDSIIKEKNTRLDTLLKIFKSLNFKLKFELIN